MITVNLFGGVEKVILIYDDYNSSIRNDQSTIGTLTSTIGNFALRNGYKLIEVYLNYEN